MFNKGTIQHLCSLPCVKNWTFSDVVKKGRPPNRVQNTVTNNAERVCKVSRLQTVSSLVKDQKCIKKQTKIVNKNNVVQKFTKKICCIPSELSNQSLNLSNRFEVLKDVNNENHGVSNQKTTMKVDQCTGKTRKNGTKKKIGNKVKLHDMENFHETNDVVVPETVNSQDSSKYDLGLSTIANKNEKIRVAKTAQFNQKVFQQNSLGFGFLPLSKLPTPISDNSIEQEISVIEAHKKLVLDGRPNYLGLQIPVKSALNHEKFATCLGTGSSLI